MLVAGGCWWLMAAVPWRSLLGCMERRGGRHCRSAVSVWHGWSWCGVVVAPGLPFSSHEALQSCCFFPDVLQSSCFFQDKPFSFHEVLQSSFLSHEAPQSSPSPPPPPRHSEASLCFDHAAGADQSEDAVAVGVSSVNFPVNLPRHFCLKPAKISSADPPPPEETSPALVSLPLCRPFLSFQSSGLGFSGSSLS